MILKWWFCIIIILKWSAHRLPFNRGTCQNAVSPYFIFHLFMKSTVQTSNNYESVLNVFFDKKYFKTLEQGGFFVFLFWVLKRIGMLIHVTCSMAETLITYLCTQLYTTLTNIRSTRKLWHPLKKIMHVKLRSKANVSLLNYSCVSHY